MDTALIKTLAERFYDQVVDSGIIFIGTQKLLMAK